MVLNNGIGKYRLRFRKTGELRLVSHHDLLHCFERMLRRASLPIRHTQGFHPHPRMTFALSLALGVTGCAEVVELELTEPLSCDEVQERLRRQAPPGLEIVSVCAVDLRSRPQVRRAWYRVALPAERCLDLPERIEEVLAAAECWVERVRPQRRRLDLRPYISVLRLADTTLQMALWISSHGAARPEEILSLLGLGDLLEAGALCLERSDLELMDEVAADAEPLPEALRQGPRQPIASPRPADVKEPSKTHDQGRSLASSESPGREPVHAASATSLISSPMEFDA